MRYVGEQHPVGKIVLVGVCLCASAGLFVAALLSVVAWPVAPVLIAGLIYAALCMHRPLIGFLMALFLQVFDQLLILVPYTGSGGTSILNSLTVPKLMFAALFAVLVSRVLLTKDEAPLRALRRQKLFILLALLFLLGCLPGIVYSGLNAAVMLPFSRLLNCVALAFTAIALIRDFRSVWLVFAILVPAFAITGVMGAYETMTETYILDLLDRPIPEDFELSAEAGQFRVLGPSGDAVYYAVSLCVAIVAVIIVMQLVRNRWALLACLATLGLFALGIVSTASRGALLACGAFGFVFFALATIRHKWTILAATVAACVLGIAVYSVTISHMPLARFMGLAGADEGTANRLGFWSQCLRMIEDSPLIGVGMGQFKDYQVDIYFDARTPQRPYLPHNVYLQVAAETGLPNLVVYLAILLASSVPLFAVILRMPPSPQRNIAVAILGGVAGLAVFATNTNLRDNELMWLLMALACIAGTACRDAHQEASAAVATAALPPGRRAA